MFAFILMTVAVVSTKLDLPSPSKRCVWANGSLQVECQLTASEVSGLCNLASKLAL